MVFLLFRSAITMALSPDDPNSHSVPGEVLTKHLHFDWDIDFAGQTVTGDTSLTCHRLAETVRTLSLDTNQLHIKRVLYNSEQDLQFRLGPHGCCGSRLEIDLPPSCEEKFTVVVSHTSSQDCPALLWLTADQTASKQLPFLFSQGQAILNRALFPCQDTPAVKTTYTATIRADSHLTVLMSALSEGHDDGQEGGSRQWKFRQPVPIPSYLVAFAVGLLSGRKVGPRSTIWAEEEYLEKAVTDFSETETMLRTAEDLCGPYVWTVYDILVLPSSFAFGGMENPCLTFVTPTLLTGDKSNADVIAHEITHSWTGNLITNSTFEHFWLNEGFTVFIERKIRGRMKGEAERHFTSMLRWKELEEAVNEEFSPDHEFTKLVPSLIGVDPDDAFCRVPYEKGSTFLWYLEEKVGGSAVFEPFMKDYFKEFSFKSLNSDEFKDYFTKYFQHKPSLDIDWASWYYKPGMPDYKPDFDQSLACHCWQLADKWLEHDKTDVLDCNFDRQELERLSPTQVQELLSYLLQKPPVRSDTVQKMDDVYKLSDSLNCEILFLFLRLGLRSRWEPAVDKTLGFLKTMGRLKFVRPLYRDLAKWDEKKQTAVEFFTNNKHLLMSMVVDGVVKDLDI